MTQKRLFLFAGYDKDGIIDDALVHYARAVSEFGDIVLCMDSDCPTSEMGKLKKYTLHTIATRHGEYDFGSYKRGYMWLSEHGILDKCDELLLCNDSCYGPLRPFKEVFNTMSKKDCDFWGLLSNTENQYRLQSYFLKPSNKDVD